MKFLGTRGGVVGKNRVIFFTFGAFGRFGRFLVHNQLFNFVQILVSVFLCFGNSMIKANIVVFFIWNGRLVDHKGRDEFFFHMCIGAGDDTGLDGAVVERVVYVIVGYLL